VKSVIDLCRKRRSRRQPKLPTAAGEGGYARPRTGVLQIKHISIRLQKYLQPDKPPSLLVFQDLTPPTVGDWRGSPAVKPVCRDASLFHLLQSSKLFSLPIDRA